MKTKTLIEELISFKKRAGWKQRVLATEIGVNKYTLNRWLKGHNSPMPAHEKMIKRFLKNNC